MNNAAAAHISIAHGLRGPLLNVSTACSSSAASVGEAFRAIQWGQAEVVVAGGSEALITYGNLCAWDAMRALAHADPSRSVTQLQAIQRRPYGARARRRGGRADPRNQ